MKFNSSKNHVEIKKDRVIKRFVNDAALNRELKTITELRSADVAVPAILSTANKYIEYELINGLTYYSLIESFQEKHAQALVNWLQDYYKATNKLRGDVNLRNFIYDTKSNSCIGIDFEDNCAVGSQETDFGKIIAFIATYDPPFSDKKKQCARLIINEFIKTGADVEKINESYHMEIKAMIARRQNKKYNLEQAWQFWQGLIDVWN